MKDNKVLSAIYGIALFVALIGIVALLYSAIEMLNYTTFYDVEYLEGKYIDIIQPAYTELQKPIAIALLIASVIGILGVCAGVGYLFVKKPLLKKICLACVVAAVVTVVTVLIVVCSYWNKFYSKKYKNYNKNPNEIFKNSSDFALYSASLTSVIQNLVCFAVIAAVLVYDFVKGIKDKRKETATKEVVVEEITE